MIVDAQKIKNTEGLKFYQHKVIAMAAFFGGPVVAGYFIRENCNALNESERGRKVLIYSILATALLFCLLFMLPEHIVDKIPKMIIPAISAGLVYFIVEKMHGNILRQHEEESFEFQSNWKAFGITLLITILTAGLAFLLIFIIPDKVNDAYDAEFDKFSKNESETLVFYDHLEIKDDLFLINELNEVVIPKWKENIEICKNIGTIEGITSELEEHNKHLLKYSELRLEAFELYKKSILLNTDMHYDDLESVHHKIDEVLDKLNQ